MENGAYSLMKLLFILLLPVQPSSAVAHSLQYLYTAITPGINLPAFTVLGLVDGEQFVHYDSSIRKMIPNSDWIQKISADVPQYWNSETQRMQKQQENFIEHIMKSTMQSFNHTQGVHTLQRMYGCELHDDSSTRGYDQYGYDGENFISLDLKTLTWSASIPQAQMFKTIWESTGAEAKYWKSYLETDCIDWLKKYMIYNRETLDRKVPPEVSLFQKHLSSPEVVCHATGFFPKALKITWQKDGEDVHEKDVELRETLPNQDGSFQKRSVLKVPAEELQKHTYTCVIQHSSLEKELKLHAGKPPITKDDPDEDRFPFESGKHSLQYLYTTLTSGMIFPEFTAVGLVNGQQIVYYDSNIMKMIPKTKWIQKIEAEEPDYWETETKDKRNEYYTLKDNMDKVQKSFSHTRGVHTLQRMYGCELNDDGTVFGYDHYGYDGENFMRLDLKTGTWITAKSQAVTLVEKWDPKGAKAKHRKIYLEFDCINWLKKYTSYGRETLERKVPPEVSLFLIHSSSPEVVCHATGFFPKAVMITWQKDGEDMHEDMELRETLPNQDGSFQKRNILKVPAEELQKHTYTCVIQHSSLEKELVLPVSQRRILRGGGDDGGAGGGAGIVLICIIIGVVVGIAAGVWLWKKKNSGFKPDSSLGSREECEMSLRNRE